MKQCIFVLSALSALVCAPIFAHHSFAAFDLTKDATIRGTVREFQWHNPHCWIQVVVKDASGKEVE